MRIDHLLKQKKIINLLGCRLEVPLWGILFVIVGAITVYRLHYQSLEGQWKTYINNRYGYSIDYPANWLLREYGSNGSKGLTYLRNEFIDLFKSNVYIHEQEIVEPDLLEVIKWGEGLDRYASNWSDVEKTVIGQDGYEAIVRTYYTRSGILGRRNAVKVYYVVMENQVIALEFDPHKKNYADRPDAFDHMLKSFHLIEMENQG